MAEKYFNNVRCFLCRRKSPNPNKYKNVEATKCPASGKPLKDVLDYLARTSKTNFVIPNTESVCKQCHCQLLEYDSILVRLLQTQKSLTNLLENVVIGYDSDVEKECNEHMSTMEEFINEDFFKDFSVSESEITQTVNEALRDAQKRKDPRKHQNVGDRRISRETLECQFCPFKFRSKFRLQKHTAKAHHKFTCELCNFSHRNEDYVMLHMNLHEGREENQCRFCFKNFTTKISTIRHMEVHMNSKKYQCDKCGLCFSQTTVLYNHKLQHEAEEDPLRCEICGQLFKTKRTFRHHMITHQADRPRYKCEHCSKTFTEKYTLKVHRRTHGDVLDTVTSKVESAVQSIASDNPQPETKLNCIICEQTFVSKDNLNRHMEKDHDVILKSLTLSNFSQYEVVTNEPRKACHVCGHMFNTQTNLSFHLERVHGFPIA